eukprot:NODE_75_length_23955_cov_0.435069.p24 type:complete len:117 gc:universal NODE_75_length_23955_cov_0.435069:4264-3914(-)
MILILKILKLFPTKDITSVKSLISTLAKYKIVVHQVEDIFKIMMEITKEEKMEKRDTVVHLVEMVLIMVHNHHDLVQKVTKDPKIPRVSNPVDNKYVLSIFNVSNKEPNASILYFW